MNFDINRYLGVWYEMASVPSWFQRRLKNVTAEYQLIENGKISVVNRGIGEITGITQVARGSARVVSLSGNPLLKVKFFIAESDYKILQFDPNYQYALVGGESPNFVWILSRQKTIPKAVFDDYVQIAKSYGYNTEKLRRTKHD